MHLSCVLGSPVLGATGERVGELVDVIVHIQPVGYPPVSGAIVRTEEGDRYCRIADFAELSCDEVRLGDSAQLGPFERRAGEVLLSRDLSARHLIHVASGKLVRANEIELAEVRGRLEVIGVDPTTKPVFRRVLPRRWRNGVRPGHVMVDWADIQPFVSHVPTARLQIPFRKLARLHPAQLADLVEAASHEEGEEIIRTVGADRELEADVFEELEPERQVEFLAQRSDDDAARLLGKMAPDDAVDLLTELRQERRLPILEKLPTGAQRKIRTLLRYHPETAGGLMNPDFVLVPSTATVQEALAAVRASTAPAEAAAVVYVSDHDGHLGGSAPVVDLLRANPNANVGTVVEGEPVALPPDADVHEVVRKMADYNLAVAPVVDTEGTMLGQITVDDVLELLLPAGWRRQYGMAAPD